MIALDATRRTVAIEFLYLDLEVCTRCRGTDANLEAALAAAGGVLEAAGVDRESRCESEACACATGGGDPIDCRVWVYQGKDYTEAPVPMIVDAILSGVYGAADADSPAPAPAPVPENLLRLFQSRERSKSACCDARQQESCCGPSEKASCCGAPKEADARACGCQ